MPARTVPTALLSGVGIVTACYVALNVAYLQVLPIEVLGTSTRVAADAGARVTSERAEADPPTPRLRRGLAVALRAEAGA